MNTIIYPPALEDHWWWPALPPGHKQLLNQQARLSSTNITAVRQIHFSLAGLQPSQPDESNTSAYFLLLGLYRHMNEALNLDFIITAFLQLFCLGTYIVCGVQWCFVFLLSVNVNWRKTLFIGHIFVWHLIQCGMSLSALWHKWNICTKEQRLLSLKWKGIAFTAAHLFTGPNTCCCCFWHLQVVVIYVHLMPLPQKTILIQISSLTGCNHRSEAGPCMDKGWHFSTGHYLLP